MAEIYHIADLHLGHASAVKFRGFDDQKQHDECVLDGWCSVVGKRDTVWVHGDVAFGACNLDLLKRLPGVKKLILGNHDTYETLKYLEHFNKVYGTMGFKRGVCLSHIPVHPDELDLRWKYNIHGHLHSEKLEDDRYYCVSAEQTNYKPVLFSKIWDYFCFWNQD